METMKLTDRIGALVKNMPDDARVDLSASDVKRLVMLSNTAVMLSKDANPTEEKIRDAHEPLNKAASTYLAACIETSKITCPRCLAYKIEQDLMTEGYNRDTLFCPHCMSTYFLSSSLNLKGEEDRKLVEKHLLFQCCGGNDEHPPEHCQDCPSQKKDE
jgi:hypothetical protein